MPFGLGPSQRRTVTMAGKAIFGAGGPPVKVPSQLCGKIG